MARASSRTRSDYGGPACPRCRKDLDPEFVHSGEQSCPHCGGSFEATRFEPPPARVQVLSLEQAGPDGATACAVHRGNAAIGNCGRCGVFMCDLCRLEVDGQVLCPGCFDRLSAEGALPSARASFRDYSRMGATFLLAGLLLWIVALPFALGAVYAGVMALRQRKQLGEGSAGRAWVAIVLGLAEAAGSIALWLFVLAPGLRR